MSKPSLLLVPLAALLLNVLPAHAQIFTVGAGIGTPNDELDDTQFGRVNLDISSPVTLAAGTYTASLFSFDAGQAGTTTPFLAFQDAPGQFTALVVGTTQTLSGAVTDTTVPFGANGQFTLAATTVVYAGIATPNGFFNPILFDQGTGPNTNHEGGGQAASTYMITPGGPVPGDDGFSNANLGRTYAFSITVVPEPATGVLLLGSLGLLAVRRRRA